MVGEATQQALDLATCQLDRLKQGDLDGYLADEDAYARACGRVADLENVSEEEEDALRHLLGLATSIGAEMERLMDEASARMRDLNDRKRIAAAYYATGPSTPTNQLEF